MSKLIPKKTPLAVKKAKAAHIVKPTAKRKRASVQSVSGRGPVRASVNLYAIEKHRHQGSTLVEFFECVGMNSEQAFRVRRTPPCFLGQPTSRRYIADFRMHDQLGLRVKALDWVGSVWQRGKKGGM